MNSIAHAVRSTHAMRAAQQAWDDMLPEDVTGPEPTPVDVERYVKDWISGDLVELAGQDIYHAPQERLTEDDWLAQLLAAKDDEELLQAARIVQSKLRQFVEEQAEELG